MENNEVMYEEVDTVIDAINEEPVKSSGVLRKVAYGALFTCAAAVGAWLWKKNEPKREERAIKKLEKKGYVVYMPEADIEDDVTEDESYDSEG